MRKALLFVFFIFIFISFTIFSTAKFPDIKTILVIIEETQNGKLENDDYPISDGIFDALWEYEDYLFFDMKLKERIKINNNELDPKDYVEIAKSAGADSILMIKVNYLTQTKNNILSVIINDFSYSLVALKNLNVLKKGKENFNFIEEIEIKNKNQVLKKAGGKIISIIFS